MIRNGSLPRTFVISYRCVDIFIAIFTCANVRFNSYLRTRPCSSLRGASRFFQTSSQSWIGLTKRSRRPSTPASTPIQFLTPSNSGKVPSTGTTVKLMPRKRIALQSVHIFLFSQCLRYLLCPVLDPRYKIEYMREHEWPQEWIATAERMVRERFTKKYRPQAPTQVRNILFLI